MNYRLSTRLLTTLACLATLPSAVSAAEQYVVDTAHTSVVFSVSHLNLSYTYGMFRQYEGSYVLDRANPANCQFKFTIQVDSIDTNNQQRDNHLRQPDFFNAQQFPTITFESTAVALAQTQDGSVVYQVTGNLTMHGTTRQVTLPLQMLGEGEGPRGGQLTGFLSQFTIKRSDFGMTNHLNTVGDPVAVTLSFEGIRQDAQ